MRFTFGTDPEFMLTKDSNYYSAIGIIADNEDFKHQLGKHQAYYDNVMVECAVSPATNKKGAVKNIGDCLKKCSKLVNPYKLVAQAAQDYPKNQLQHKDAKKVGCRPEICAYSLLSYSPDPLRFATEPLRTSGGHVHLGAKFILNNYTYFPLTLMMDLFVGVPSVFLDHDPTSKRRKQLYGRGGRFRICEYGMEYRSMGNFWLTSPKLVSLIWELSEFTLNFVNKKEHLALWDIDYSKLTEIKDLHPSEIIPSKYQKCKKYDPEELRSVIDNMDKSKAEKFLSLIQTHMPAGLSRKIEKLSNEKEFDMYTEWDLK
jgi:hypothetical protein